MHMIGTPSAAGPQAQRQLTHITKINMIVITLKLTHVQLFVIVVVDSDYPVRIEFSHLVDQADHRLLKHVILTEQTYTEYFLAPTASQVSIEIARECERFEFVYAVRRYYVLIIVFADLKRLAFLGHNYFVKSFHAVTL